MIHTVKGFSIVNEVEVYVFLELSCFFYDPIHFGNLICGSSALSKSSLYIWKLSLHILLKLNLKDFLALLASMGNECHLYSSLNILWHCFSLRLELKRTFSSPGATAGFSKFAGILSAAL